MFLSKRCCFFISSNITKRCWLMTEPIVNVIGKTALPCLILHFWWKGLKPTQQTYFITNTLQLLSEIFGFVMIEAAGIESQLSKTLSNQKNFERVSNFLFHLQCVFISVLLVCIWTCYWCVVQTRIVCVNTQNILFGSSAWALWSFDSS